MRQMAAWWLSRWLFILRIAGVIYCRIKTRR